MKLSDYSKMINKLAGLGYPVGEMTITDFYMMVRVFTK
jgi:hypothetical protein